MEAVRRRLFVVGRHWENCMVLVLILRFMLVWLFDRLFVTAVTVDGCLAVRDGCLARFLARSSNWLGFTRRNSVSLGETVVGFTWRNSVSLGETVTILVTGRIS